ncbi:hypothetical protein [Variovorax sp.]|uniref:hypothetical protein n=1 Tax=Variovorax sp. TaxID=1871043 RepID=UPI000C363A96|nr:hypothetical protein [Variovorax sp.]MBS79021.1 hypothetical protein [Variovorax sp.]
MSTTENKEFQGAEILAFPGARSAPIHNDRHYGRYPRGVASLRKLRVEKRAAERQEAAEREMKLDDVKRAAARALNDLMSRALEGKLDGFLYLYDDRETGEQTVRAIGRFSENISLALDACERGADAIRDHIARKAQAGREVQD